MNITDNSVNYYTVGSKKFYSKTLALIEATRTNIFPNWHFGNGIFDTVDWNMPVADITEVYQKRARQLREKYDYLVLCFSGGSDSTTVLHSFLSQNILIDEILVRWPLKGTQNLYKPGTSLNPENILSEWDFSIKPKLDYIRQYFPKIKITIEDWSETLDRDILEEEWFSINDHMNPGVFRKYGGLSASHEEIAMIDKGKKTAVMWGVDKPQLAYKDNNIYFYFIDKLANFAFINGTANRNVELFYWTPDCPELVVTQARLVYEYFIKNPKMISLIDWNTRRTNNKTLYNDIIRRIVYPNWDLNTFQAGKPELNTKCEYDGWMFTALRTHRYLDSWQSNLKSIRNTVNEKYFHYAKNGEFDGWVGFISPFYKIGPFYQPEN